MAWYGAPFSHPKVRTLEGIFPFHIPLKDLKSSKQRCWGGGGGRKVQKGPRTHLTILIPQGSGACPQTLRLGRGALDLGEHVP